MIPGHSKSIDLFNYLMCLFTLIMVFNVAYLYHSYRFLDFSRHPQSHINLLMIEITPSKGVYVNYPPRTPRMDNSDQFNSLLKGSYHV